MTKKSVQKMDDSLATTPKVCHNADGTSVNLENEIYALPSVQVTREIVSSNGCRVTLNFATEKRFDIQMDIARMLVESFENKRRKHYEETSSMPVQSFDQAAG